LRPISFGLFRETQKPLTFHGYHAGGVLIGMGLVATFHALELLHLKTIICRNLKSVILRDMTAFGAGNARIGRSDLNGLGQAIFTKLVEKNRFKLLVLNAIEEAVEAASTFSFNSHLAPDCTERGQVFYHNPRILLDRKLHYLIGGHMHCLVSPCSALAATSRDFTPALASSNASIFLPLNVAQFAPGDASLNNLIAVFGNDGVGS
jgi:hypothetical protein